MTDRFDSDYQTVAERIKIFREKYPNGCLRPADVEHPFRLVNVRDQAYVVVTAAAYRTPDDPAPGIGQAWEPVPGVTEFSLGSEIMVCETSAWGRAIIAVGAADSRRVASADEVTSAAGRRAAVTSPPARPAPKPQPVSKAQPAPATAPATATVAAAAAPAAAAATTAAASTFGAVAVDEVPGVHNSEEDTQNRAIVDEALKILADNGTSVQEVRDVWQALSQARLLAWRVDPIEGAPIDGDGKITIGALAAFVGKTRSIK